MKTIDLKMKPFRTVKEKEELFLALENDADLLKETFEVILTLVISDPALNSDIADLIQYEYRELYLAIKNRKEPEKYTRAELYCCMHKN